MSRPAGEAALAAPEANEFIVTDHYGSIHGRFRTQGEAIAWREYLIALGAECWVVAVEGLEVEEAPRFLTDRDTGDEAEGAC